MLSKQRKKFFNDLALEMCLLDPVQAEKYYYNFVKFIVRNANNNESVELPDLGVFKIILCRERRSYIGGLDGQKSKEKSNVIIPAKRTMNFYPAKKLKEYLNRYLDGKKSDML